MNNEYACVDCGFDTAVHDEYYMVKDNLWPIEPDGGMLCIGCLEKRIGRKLNKKDFPNLPINRGFFPYSDRLKDRLKRKG